MNNLLKNTSIYAIGNIIPQIANFFLLPIYVAYLSPSDYGVVQSMQILSAILVIIFTLAVDRAVYRLYFDFKSKDDKKTYLSTIVISLFIISFLVLVVLFVLKSFVGQIFSSISFYPYYFYAILVAYFSVFAIIPKIYYQINEKANSFITLSLLQFVMNTGFVLWYVVFLKTGAGGWLKALTLSNLINLPIYMIISYKIINFKFKFRFLKESLRFSLPILPSLLSAWVLNLSDRIFIENYFSLSDVGIYSLGYKIAGLVLIVSGAFHMAYNPIFYKLANSDSKKKVREKLSVFNFIFLNIVLFIVFTISLFSKEIVTLFFSPDYYDAYKIIRIISIAYLFNQTGGIFNLSIYQKKKTSILMFIMLGSALMNIILNFILIPIFGVYGAAYATVISFFIFACVKYIFARKYYFIPMNWGLVLLLLLGLITIVFIFSLINLTVVYMIILKILIMSILLGSAYFFYFDKIKKELFQLAEHT